MVGRVDQYLFKSTSEKLEIYLLKWKFKLLLFWFQVSTVIIDVDFTADAASYIPRLTTELEDYSIGVLVNNVGMSLEHPMPFLDIEEATLKKLVDVNITSMNAMTRFILPQMVERRKGAIINIGSMSSRIPNPMYSVYAGAKAYVEKFSDCIQKEYGSKGITIQCVTPGYVVSNMSKIKRSSWLAPTPEAFVKSALNKLGTHPLTTGYFSHEVMLNFINCLPGPLANKLVWDQLSAIRQKALRKKNKEQ